MSQYPVIYPEDALRYLKSRQHDGAVMLEDIRRTAGSGEAISADALEELRTKLLRLKKKYPAKLRAKDPQGGKFESDACALVHACLSDLDRRALADHDFWTWLAVDFLADILEWRFGADGRPAQPANYGIGTRTENMYFRLWLRADLGKVSGSDPYELAKFGDQDLWRAHLLRQGYANARSIVRALLKLQAGKLMHGSKPAKKVAGGHEPEGVRMLAKRLRRVRANVVFEYLTPVQADALVFELSSDLKKGK
jgi:hypothetical protein